MKFNMQKSTCKLFFALCMLPFAFCISSVRAADREFTVKGMVLRADPANRSFVVSHEKIVGLMDSMIMPFDVRDAKDLAGVVPGAVVEFTLVVSDTSAYATKITIQRYQSVEQDPRTARRLAVMRKMAGLATKPLKIGAHGPGQIVGADRHDVGGPGAGPGGLDQDPGNGGQTRHPAFTVLGGFRQDHRDERKPSGDRHQPPSDRHWAGACGITV